MNLFISWSGERSRIVAEALHGWITYILQTVQPWISSASIDAGSRWAQELQDKLQDTNFGIICLTAENLLSPWVHFEAGALAKSVSTSFVCPYLIDLRPSDIPPGPLTQFQSKQATKTGTWELVCTINKNLGEDARNPNQLDKLYERFWPDLEECIINLDKFPQAIPKQRETNEMIVEILEIVRSLRRDKDIISILENFDFQIDKEDAHKCLANQILSTFHTYRNDFVSGTYPKAFKIFLQKRPVGSMMIKDIEKVQDTKVGCDDRKIENGDETEE